jgi:tripartite-type tricarboxylate transporter receptor subunit TctC
MKSVCHRAAAVLKAAAIIPGPTHAFHPEMPIRRADPDNRHIRFVRQIRKLPRRTFLKFAAAAVVGPAFSRLATAQTHPSRPDAQSYPSRPITIMVAFPPGGATDVIARNLAERMKVSLGQPVIIENVTGANGTIGTRRVAHASPDGYTLVIGNVETHVAAGATFAALQYDVVSDFEPVALIATTPRLFLARKTIPAEDLKGLIAWLKSNPDKASFGTAGPGIGEIAGILFQKRTGTRFGFVPYRGGAPNLQDVAAGQLDLAFLDATTSLAQVRAGNVKAFAVAAAVRLSSAPEIPTVDEAGLPGFYVSHWHGLWVPKGTPPAVIAKLNAAVVQALADPGVRARLADLGQEIFPSDQQTPEALAALQKAEIAKWWPIIKAANIRGE